MSLREINTILGARQSEDWQSNPNIDALSQCVLIAYDKLPINKDRILVVGINADNAEMFHRRLRAMRKLVRIISSDNPRELALKYFDLDSKREPDAPFAVIVGQTLRTKINNIPVFYDNGSTPPMGLHDPFKVIEGLSQKYGTKLIRSNLGKGRVDEIAKQLFS